MLRHTKPWLEWVLLALATAQFVRVALPPGNADLISVQSLALDLSHHDRALLYPGKGFAYNDAWIAHHERNLRQLRSDAEPNWCFYLPLIPFVLAPLAGVDAEIWRLTWGGIQLGLLLGFAQLIRKILIATGAARSPRRILILALVIGSYPVARAVELGQTSLAIAVLLWGGVYLGLRQRHVLRAGLLGLSATAKPFLIVTEIPQLIDGKFRRAVSTGLVLVGGLAVSILAVGWRAHLEYGHLLSTLASSQTAYYGNQSLLAGLLRIGTDLPVMDYGFQQDRLLSAFGRALSLLVLGLAYWAQRRARQVDPIVSVGLWLSAIFLALPISWEHHLVFLLPTVACLWIRLIGKRQRVALAVSTLLMAVCWVPLYGDDVPGRWVATLPAVGNVVLFVILLIYHRQNRQPPLRTSVGAVA